MSDKKLFTEIKCIYVNAQSYHKGIQSEDFEKALKDADLVITSDGEVIKSRYFFAEWMLSEQEIRNEANMLVERLIGSLKNRKRKYYDK